MIYAVLVFPGVNLTPEYLTMTVLAPASFTSPPSVGSLTSPKTSLQSFVGLTESRSVITGGKLGTLQKSFSEQASIHRKHSNNDGFGSVLLEAEADVIPSNDYGCTHLWLQSRVPLGRVPAQSTATIKLDRWHYYT